MNPVLESLIVLLVVAYCAISVVRKLFPKLEWQLRANLSYLFERQTRSPLLARFGRRLRPKFVLATSCSAGQGCNRCGGCAS